MLLRVTQFGEPVLRQVGEKITKFDAELERFASDMIETMRAEDGLGLAAQQVDRAVQVFVVDMCSSERERTFSFLYDGRVVPLELIMPLVVVNPELRVTPDPVTVYEEGCLSFPGIRGDVPRPEAVELRFQDLQGAWHTIQADGLFGRCIQHEFDHLQGVLFIDRMHPRTVQALDAKIKKLKRKTRDFLKKREKGVRSDPAL